MKQLLRILLGFVPLGIGYLEHLYLLWHMDTLPPLALIALGTLLIWGLLCYLTADGKKPRLQVLALNAANILALALVLVQELLLGRYWTNAVGLASQFFFLPLIHLAAFLPLHYVWLCDVVISLVLLLISKFACQLKIKHMRSKKDHPQ